MRQKLMYLVFLASALIASNLSSKADAEVPDPSDVPGGYNYSGDNPLLSRPFSPDVRAIKNTPGNLATPQDASIAAAPLGMRFFIQENSNCRNPDILVKLSYPRLIYELMEPQRLRSKMEPIHSDLRSTLCRQPSGPWHANFTVTSNGKLLGTYRLNYDYPSYTFSDVQVNWPAIDDGVVPYIDAYWKTGVVPDDVPEIREALLEEDSAESNLVMRNMDRAIELEHPLAAYLMAESIIKYHEVREAAARGRQVVMPQEAKDSLTLYVAKAYATRYIPSYIQAALLRQQGMDIDQAIELVRQVGPLATLDDYETADIDFPPSWAQVRDGLRRYLNEEQCSQLSALTNAPASSNAGTAIMALGSSFEAGQNGCRITNAAFNTSITIGISSVDNLKCTGASSTYTCTFDYYFDCGMSATGGVDLGILNPCSLLSSIPVRARAALEKRGRFWSVVDYKAN